MKSLKGTKICVSNPSGNFAIPTNTKGDTSVATTTAPIPSKVPNDTNKNCGQYAVVKEGEDCSNLLAASAITMDDFLVLNPQVWRNCTNLWLDYSYCVKPVGAISTYPGYGGTAAPSATSRPFKKTESTDQSSHNGTDPLDRFPSTDGIVPIANGTRLDCVEYYWTENTTDNLAADCWALTAIYGIEPEGFILWNPSLTDADKTEEDFDADAPSATGTMTYRNDFAYPCTVSSSVSYCVGLLSGTTRRSTAGIPHMVSRLANKSKAAAAEKEIETPTPRAAGEIANCTMWFRVRRAVRCNDVMATNGLEFGEFYKMNPSVKSDCTGLVLGTYYCRSTYPRGDSVGIPGWASTTESESESATASASATKTSTSTSSTNSGTPSPLQTGILKTCNDYHKVIKGDTCYDIAQGAKIELETFYKWNPAVKSDCSDLELDTYVCVGST
ncbi:hypothetical protein ACHAP4_011664 [Fusarium culmorum]